MVGPLGKIASLFRPTTRKMSGLHHYDEAARLWCSEEDAITSVGIKGGTREGVEGLSFLSGSKEKEAILIP